jgi:hypothetical protein
MREFHRIIIEMAAENEKQLGNLIGSFSRSTFHQRFQFWQRTLAHLEKTNDKMAACDALGVVNPRDLGKFITKFQKLIAQREYFASLLDHSSKLMEKDPS